MKRAFIEPGPLGACSMCQSQSAYLRPGPRGEPECCLGKCWRRDFDQVQSPSSAPSPFELFAFRPADQRAGTCAVLIVATISFETGDAPPPIQEPRFSPRVFHRDDEPFLRTAGFTMPRQVDTITGHVTRGRCSSCGGQGCASCKGTGEDREPTAAELAHWRASGGNA